MMRRGMWVRGLIVLGAAGLAGPAVVVSLAPSVGAVPQAVTFTALNCPTGPAVPQTWTVPLGVTSATFDVLGAGGSSGGGLGGEAKATIAVTSGETLRIEVGCAGGAPNLANGGAGGYNGGGSGGNGSILGAGGGGGASDVRRGTTVLIDAGGGGAAGFGGGAGGGAGGGGVALSTNGGDATGACNTAPNTCATGGRSGDNGGGHGVGGNPGPGNGGDGTALTGGGGGFGSSEPGGGGGGGLLGGGGGGGTGSVTGGSGAGGGGGSGLCPAPCITSSDTAVAAGTDGSITISFEVPTTSAPPSPSPTSLSATPRFTG